MVAVAVVTDVQSVIAELQAVSAWALSAETLFQLVLQLEDAVQVDAVDVDAACKSETATAFVVAVAQALAVAWLFDVEV